MNFYCLNPFNFNVIIFAACYYLCVHFDCFIFIQLMIFC